MKFRGQILKKWGCSHCYSDIVSGYEAHWGEPTFWACVNTGCPHHKGTAIPNGEDYEPDWAFNRLLDIEIPHCRSKACRK